MSGRILRGAPLWIAAALFFWVTRWVAPSVAVAVGVLLGVAVGPRLLWRVPGHLLMGGVATLVVFLWHSAQPHSHGSAVPLSPLWSGPALWALLVGAARLLCAAPPGGTLGTWALGLLSVAVCGQVRTGGAYAAAVGLYLLASLLGLRAEDDARLPLAQAGARGKLAGAALVPLSLVLGWGLILPLPHLYAFIQRKFDEAFGQELARGGFGEKLRLGALLQMLESERAVLRISGGATDYLRGAVYNQYKGGRWRTVGPPARSVATVVGRPAGPVAPQGAAGAGNGAAGNGAAGAGIGAAGAGTMELLEVQNLSSEGERLFLPLEARVLGTQSGRVNLDALGAARSTDEGGWTRVWWLQGDVGESGPVVAGPVVAGPRVAGQADPGPEDVALPQELRGALQRLAEEWTAGATEPLVRLQRLERRLSHEYKYALRYERTVGSDPVLDFLLVHRQGHCEYFASALALLSRALGIPARVVGGYRVTEHNALGSYWVVRENNAHAWVEAYVDRPAGLRGWRQLEPTPVGDVPQNRPHASGAWDAAADLLSLGANRLYAGLRERVWEASLSASGLLGGLVLVRRLRERRARRAAGAARPEVGLGPPLLGYVALAEALSRGGARRAGWETLEAYAGRLVDMEAAGLLLRYAALRYGGAGASAEAAELDRQMAACAARLRQAARLEDPGAAC